MDKASVAGSSPVEDLSFLPVRAQATQVDPKNEADCLVLVGFKGIAAEACAVNSASRR